MIHSTFPAMGTDIEVWAETETRLDATRDWIDLAERACSRFRDDSELSIVNASNEPTQRVSPLLSSVLEAADRARALTGGLVDIGVGTAMTAWGYDRTFSSIERLAGAPTPPPAPGWSLDGRELRRDRGTTLDLGGVAKGWACDQAIERGLASVVSAGGDLRSAHPLTTVPLVDPWGQVAADLRVGLGGLATSSVTRRRWNVGSGDVCHVMDPRTMSPVETPILSASVVADTAAEAEAGAKAVVILGEEGLAWASSQDWVRAAVVVWHDGSVYATSGVELAA